MMLMFMYWKENVNGYFKVRCLMKVINFDWYKCVCGCCWCDEFFLVRLMCFFWYLLGILFFLVKNFFLGVIDCI